MPSSRPTDVAPGAGSTELFTTAERHAFEWAISGRLGALERAAETARYRATVDGEEGAAAELERVEAERLALLAAAEKVWGRQTKERMVAAFKGALEVQACELLRGSYWLGDG